MDFFPFINMYAIKDAVSRKRVKCRKKFLKYFPGGFGDETYIEWERNYKWQAHLEWLEELNKGEYQLLMEQGGFSEIASRAIRIESRTNLLFSFEKMALRDAVRTPEGARIFSTGLFDYLYGQDSMENRFERFTKTLSSLPRKQTRVVTWPLQTVFGFIGDPAQHIFLKPRVTQAAALAFDYNFNYTSKPNWDTYESLLSFAQQVRRNNADLRPRDMIDLQSFIWVMGSDEYPG